MSSKCLSVVRKTCLKSSQIFIVASTILLSLFITLLCIGFLVNYEVHSDVSNIENYWKVDLPLEQQKWYEESIMELKRALTMDYKRKEVQNVMLFMINGMTFASIAAARFQNGSVEAKQMMWDKFPHVGRLQHNCSMAADCDAFTLGTALFGGVETNAGVGGFDASVAYDNNCSQEISKDHQVSSILQQAQDIGLRTGLLTTGRLTAPTIAALYAHTSNTALECDAGISNCMDTAQQLVFSSIGSNMNVLMGGGRQTLVSHVPIIEWDPIDENACNSEDNRNLLRTWYNIKLKAKKEYRTLLSNEELQAFNGSNVDYVLGVFANGNLKFGMPPKVAKDKMPDLESMLQKSLAVLERKSSGYLFVAEYLAGTQVDGANQAEELRKIEEILQKVFKNKSVENTLSLIVFTNIEMKTPQKHENDLLAHKNVGTFMKDSMVYARGPKSYLFDGISSETSLAVKISYALRMGHFNPNSNNM